ncbi:hypothetical protein [Halorientalis marina]|uniref:hypothetical protein n=1 Tax=Halorientalis marina TaxID=2931976 RepID=UPI001FF3E230|nr:hypothetical protein [Halorientalis marina]
MTIPKCEECDTRLVQITDLPLDRDLEHGKQLEACPECYASSEGVDKEQVAEDIEESWRHYSDDFEGGGPAFWLI